MTYYVFHPSLGVTADVEAPDTRHARTVYLDYLARNDLIPWSQRLEYRKGVRAVRMSPGEIPTSVSLAYGESFSSEELTVPSMPVEGQNPDTLVLQDEGAHEQLPEEDLQPTPVSALTPIPRSQAPAMPDEFVESQAPTISSQVFGDSPISRVSKMSGGF